MAKILIKYVKLIENNQLSSNWIKTSIRIDKSELEKRRKMITSFYKVKQCLFIYEEKG